MPLGRTRAEALLASGDELACQRDLRHEHESLLPACERRGERLEINLCLSRAGDAVEQAYGKATAGVGEERTRGFSLFRRELRPFAPHIERHGLPVRQLLGHKRA